MRLPFGWVERQEPERTRFIGFDFGVAWPFVALYVSGSLLGLPTFLRSLALWAGLTALAVPIALLRGFRLDVGRKGFTMWRTWCGIPYWRVQLPLDARVEAVGGFGDPPDRLVIERKLHSEDIVLGSASTCDALCAAISLAQARWHRDRDRMDRG